MEEERRWPNPAGGEGEAAADGAPASVPNPPCEMVDLSGRGLEQLPEHIFHIPGLQNLYLEGNAITVLSEDFFHQLPNLIWLDLRNNKLTSLPLSIGDHRYLKTLLLEGNPIRKLPVELEMPLIEKLQLNVRTESSLGFSDEKEWQRFKTLKQKLMQEEKREDSFQSRKVWGAGFLSTTSNIPREKTPNLNAIFPELTSYDMSIQTKRKNELRLAALKEHKEKQAFIEQRRKDQKALKDWRDQAKLIQEKKQTERKQRSVHATERNKVVKSAPYATDPNFYCTTRSVDSKGPHIPESMQRVHSGKEMEEARAAKDKELQEQIQQHIKLMQDRRKRPKGTAQEELEAAKNDLEIATNLKSTLARRKIVDNLSENNFIAVFGGPLSSTAPTINSQNGISTMKL
ncbi:leucine-rich repeat-containing protein 27-like isoform X2 [Heterodontus francisci]|uniref:leucine-rich repeat-containing protein 27-like isoform X2 n=1 Tax=Heterodontus francisci TaxID=7792 RepID=UPI00355B78D9